MDRFIDTMKWLGLIVVVVRRDSGVSGRIGIYHIQVRSCVRSVLRRTGMSEDATLQIVEYPNAILKKRSRQTTCEEVADLVPLMFATMRAKDGIGLAAVQVGHLYRVFVMHVASANDEPRVFINPEILVTSIEEYNDKESCLSMPGVNRMVRRPERIRLQAVNMDGHLFRMRAGGLIARCILHEIDHLDGILFTEKASKPPAGSREQRWQPNGKRKKRRS